MILTVTLNAALDVTYHVDELIPHSSHRVRAAAERSGGKGINVARALRLLEHDVRVSGFAGGSTGDAIRAGVIEAGLADALVPIAGESRRTVTVVDSDATVFNEQGPEVSTAEWERFVQLYQGELEAAAVVVLAGSLPPGVPAQAYAVLSELAGAEGIPTVLDSDGEPLVLGLMGAPSVVKPNLEELAAVTREPEVSSAANELRGRGAGAVVVSCGPAGLVAVTESGSWQASPPERVTGNPTGAGDAVVAAIAAGIATGQSWPDRLSHAVALSAAAAATPLAGDVDVETYLRLLDSVGVEEIEEGHAPQTHG